MRQCQCSKCREAREDYPVRLQDVVGLIAIVTLMILFFVFLPLGEW